MNYRDGNFIQYDKKIEKKENRSIGWYLTTHITLYILLFTFLIFFVWYVIFCIGHQYFVVEGISMQPTLNDSITTQDGTEDAVYVNLYKTPTRGDIVVLDNVQTSKGETSIIKRVIATVGDFVSVYQVDTTYHVYIITAGNMTSTVDADSEIVYTSLITDEEACLVESTDTTGYEIGDGWETSVHSVNGYDNMFYSTFSIEAYLNGEQVTYTYYTSGDGLVYVQVPEDCYFCLGDNRGHSSDSRAYGFFSSEKVVGKVDIVVYDYNFVVRLWEVVKYYWQEIEIFFKR